ncbi:LytTR family DNA-binding domain-containing protein [Ponticoccus alexandrii]|uniref:HTH LytTR-type domain-containing protein n=1 Tax=Ponticoccus alexandrii TaxID=1943633 RepID=A0ABX7FA08_9RHOB|nr:LytTR family DNA-binding domain-containing protein [Ponticoccus alexandrii]ETA52162.1 hypothetical protein P279_10165 [Rhodobacteraceae bacterium PD-2]QRF66959.1 hypothetical protein GQA70_11935 [Ponticoccus alexandrii]
MSSISDRTVQLVDIGGLNFALGPGELVVLLRHNASRLYLLCVYALLVVTDAPGLYGQVAVPVILTFWLFMLTFFLATLWCILFALAAAQNRLGPWKTPAPLVMALAVLPGTFVGEHAMGLLTEGRHPPQLFPQVVFYFIMAEVFGILFLKFVRPAIEGRAHETGRHIVIGASPVPLSRLRHIEAREHHVHVTLDGESLTQRARLGDIVAQTAPEDGFQPHRSWWVAAQAGGRLEKDGPKHVLQLRDGTRIPVARTRVEEVREWLERHG